MNFEKLKTNSAVAISLCASVFVSVVFMIFLYDRPLFLQLDLWRIIFVGLGITAPILFVSYLYTLGAHEEIEFKKTGKISETLTDEERIQIWAGAGSFGFVFVSLITFINIFAKSELRDMFEPIASVWLILAVIISIGRKILEIKVTKLQKKGDATKESKQMKTEPELRSPSSESPSDSQDDTPLPPPSQTPA